MNAPTLEKIIEDCRNAIDAALYPHAEALEDYTEWPAEDGISYREAASKVYDALQSAALFAELLARRVQDARENKAHDPILDKLDRIEDRDIRNSHR